MQYKLFPGKFLQHIISSPFIYSMIIPFLFFDICLEIFHRVCFFLYELPYIERGRFIRIDRYKLQYLSYTEKVNCMYCGYANGLLNYARAITGETEKYWCGIKHQKNSNFIEPEHHKDFIEYGDEDAYRNIQPQTPEDVKAQH